jgi:hypothetical protein
MLSDHERLQKAARVLALTVEALQEHMALIHDQATKNSAKGDKYWATYSNGVAAVMQCQLFVSEDMKQMNTRMGIRNDN